MSNTNTRNRRRPQKKINHKMRGKLVGLFAVVLLALVGLLGRITYINATSGKKYKKQVLTQAQQKYQSSTLPAKRGDIYDRNGTVLATSEKVYNLILDPGVLWKNYDEDAKKDCVEPTLSALVEYFDLDRSELNTIMQEKKDSHYEIIAGERRWRAAKLAGVTDVPVLIREYDKQQTMEIALIENVQRADLNPIEEAQAFQQLIQEFHLTQEEIANRVSKNRATITNSMRLLKLDIRVQDMLAEGKISSGHARALLGLEEGERQYQVAAKIIEEKLSVRDVEKLVKMMNRPPKEKKPEKGPDIDLIYRQVEDKLKSIMGTKVVINQKDKNKGRIEIEYYSQEELERLIELMESLRV